jgi:hypothetical protein
MTIYIQPSFGIPSAVFGRNFLFLGRKPLQAFFLMGRMCQFAKSPASPHQYKICGEIEGLKKIFSPANRGGYPQSTLTLLVTLSSDLPLHRVVNGDLNFSGVWHRGLRLNKSGIFPFAIGVCLLIQAFKLLNLLCINSLCFKVVIGFHIIERFVECPPLLRGRSFQEFLEVFQGPILSGLGGNLADCCRKLLPSVNTLQFLLHLFPTNLLGNLFFEQPVRSLEESPGFLNCFFDAVIVFD